LGKAEQENKDLIIQQGILTAIYYLSKGACKETRNKDLTDALISTIGQHITIYFN
jgi:hypothetical protein